VLFGKQKLATTKKKYGGLHCIRSKTADILGVVLPPQQNHFSDFLSQHDREMLHFSSHDPHLKFVRVAGVAFGLAGSGAAFSACTSAISGFFLYSFDIIDIMLKYVE
jgi:hypothetical protein